MSPLVEGFGRKAVDQLFLPPKGRLVPLSPLFIIRIERKNNWPHLEICDNMLYLYNGQKVLDMTAIRVVYCLWEDTHKIYFFFL